METLKYIKKKYKDVQSVYCTVNKKTVYNLDDYPKIILGKNGFETGSILAVKKDFNYDFKETEYVILHSYLTNEYAEIISYKENPIQHDDFNEYTKEIPVPVRDYVIDTPKHYDNSKGSLYLFAENNNLNSWEFDAIKRIVRCRKKGNFKEDIEKTITVLKLYLKESNND